VRVVRHGADAGLTVLQQVRRAGQASRDSGGVQASHGFVRRRGYSSRGYLADHWESRLKAWKLEAVGPRHKAGGTDEIDGSLTEVAEPERQAWPELCRPRPARRGGPVKMVDSRGR
jgi:hypothetical protein